MRRLAKAVVAALAVSAGVALNASAQGFDEGNSPSMPCPGARAWFEAHPELTFEAVRQRDAARTLTDPALAAELKARVERDQQARRTMLANRANRQAQMAVDAVDRDNIHWLYKLVTRQGLPTAAQVGEWGVHQAWLLAQHADDAPTFQAQLLAAFEQRHAAGDLSGGDLARFTDRVLKADAKPQRYGTQFSSAQWGSAHFGLPDDDAVRAVDANRAALGIMPLADYVCMMRYGRGGQW
jgi:hypothetical protein